MRGRGLHANPKNALIDMTNEVVTIITTVAPGEDAARIAEMLLRDRVAACVQEIPIRSAVEANLLIELVGRARVEIEERAFREPERR
ncbi:MAG: divalent cation tolerance protein CutA [Steroidobacteraceae bacterium]